MIVLLIAGTAAILAGLAAIGFGIPVKEFGFGNTLILTGTVGVCTGVIILGMAQVLRELKRLAAKAVAEPATGLRLPRRDQPLPPFGEPETDADSDAPDGADHAEGPLFTRDRSTPPRARAPDPAVPPWQDEVLRDRERLAAPPERPDEPKRRNLLFESSRRERAAQAAAGGAVEPAAEAPRYADSSMRSSERAAEGRGFDDAWPQAERPRSDAIRRAARAPLPQPSDRLPDASLIPDRYDPPAAEAERESDVVVVKSGVVDNMAYSLYSDGSIEAQMPEGRMRFASIDELREHLENRG